MKKYRKGGDEGHYLCWDKGATLVPTSGSACPKIGLLASGIPIPEASEEVF